jgi:hypothetical protein
MWRKTWPYRCSREQQFWLLLAEKLRCEPKIDSLFTLLVNMSRRWPGEPTQQVWWEDRLSGLKSTSDLHENTGSRGMNNGANNIVDLCVLWIMPEPTRGYDDIVYFVCFFFELFWYCCMCRHAQGLLIGHVVNNGTRFFDFFFSLPQLKFALESWSVYCSRIYHTCAPYLQSLTSIRFSFFTSHSRKVDLYFLYLTLQFDVLDGSADSGTCVLRQSHTFVYTTGTRSHILSSLFLTCISINVIYVCAVKEWVNNEQKFSQRQSPSPQL